MQLKLWDVVDVFLMLCGHVRKQTAQGMQATTVVTIQGQPHGVCRCCSIITEGPAHALHRYNARLRPTCCYPVCKLETCNPLAAVKLIEMPYLACNAGNSVPPPDTPVRRN